MAKKNNPAERLYSILDKARREPVQHSALQVWANVFGIDLEATRGRSEVIQQIALLYHLVEDVEKKILDMELNHDLCLRRFDKIKQAMQIDSLAGGWSNSSVHLDEATMLNLEHCSEYLSNKFSEDDIQDEITETNQKIDELWEKIYASDLPDEVRLFILDGLTLIRRGIAEYRIRGAKGLREALSTNIGNIVLNKELLSKQENKDIKEYGKILLDIDRYTAAAIRVKAIAVAVFKAVGFSE